MRRPDRNLVLSLLACGAAFAHGWQQERELRDSMTKAPLEFAREIPAERTEPGLNDLLGSGKV